MIDTPARRREIIEILYFADDYVKIRPLAVRFGVSYATIRNDVDVLSLSYRISSQTGPNGGIKLETKRKNLRFLDPDETAALLRIMYIVPEEERVYIRSILRDLALIDDKWTTAEWQRKSSDWWMLAMVMRWCCSQRTARWRKSAH